MSIVSKIKFIVVFGAILFLAGCAKSDDQRRFEERALSETPSGIIEMNVQGQRVENGETDPNDWQISPAYRGLISIGDLSNSTPPYPNPVNLNQNLNITISLNTADLNVNRFEIYSFRFSSDGLNDVHVVSEIESYNHITIQAQSIAPGYTGTEPVTYRLLVYDGNENLITYGDIRIE